MLESININFKFSTILWENLQNPEIENILNYFKDDNMGECLSRFQTSQLIFKPLFSTKPEGSTLSIMNAATTLLNMSEES